MFHKAVLALCAGLIAAAAAADPNDVLASSPDSTEPAEAPHFMFHQPHRDSFVGRSTLEFTRWRNFDALGSDVGFSHPTGNRHPRSDDGLDFGQHHGKGPPFDWQNRPGHGHAWRNDWDPGQHVSNNPEPSIYAMMGLGLLLMGLFARQRKAD